MKASCWREGWCFQLIYVSCLWMAMQHLNMWHKNTLPSGPGCTNALKLQSLSVRSIWLVSWQITDVIHNNYSSKNNERRLKGTWLEGVVCIHLAWDRDQWQAVVTTALNFCGHNYRKLNWPFGEILNFIYLFMHLLFIYVLFICVLSFIYLRIYVLVYYLIIVIFCLFIYVFIYLFIISVFI